MAVALTLSVITGTIPAMTVVKNEESVVYAEEAVTQSIVYSRTYADPVYAPPSEEQPWRQGLVTGNGENGLIESENPLDDVLIYQHMKYSFPSNEYHTSPSLKEAMEDAKQQLIQNKRYTANSTLLNQATKSKKEMFGDDAGGWHLEWSYSFHPGHQLRMTVTDNETADDYRRFTNYETAEIGAEWTDANGKKWIRTSFSSRSDNVTYTYLRPVDQDAKINMDISIDDIADMANEGDVDGSVGEIRYRKIAAANGDYLAQVAHYPNYENSDLVNGGFAGVTRIYVTGEDAAKSYRFGTAEAVDLHAEDRESNSKIANETIINVGEDKKPVVQISKADTLLLVTKSSRTYEMGTLAEFEEKTDDEALQYDMVSKLLNDTQSAYDKNVVSGEFSYDKALESHAALHSEIFNRTKLDLGADPEDRAMFTEDLLAKQKENPNSMNLALAERAYNNGRYANVCCSGYQVPRLGGMWTGAWHVEWSGDYTTDANINLQVAGSNIGNMKESVEGLLNMELRIADDLVENAYKVYGYENAMLAPTRTDGDSAPIVHFGSSFPGHVWNAGISWLLLPVYEYWQCYGNQNIPLVDDIRMKLEACQTLRASGNYVPVGTGDTYKSKQDLQEILELSDERVQEILTQGYFELESDLLRPLLEKQANLWTNLMQPQYYLSTDGVAMYDPDKTSLAEGETYLILPSYSPENTPKDGEYSITINATMDVSAARDGMNMAINMEREVFGEEADQEKIATWNHYLDKLPEYLYEDTGEVKEWLVKSYPENHGHRHISQLYGAWPGYEVETDSGLLEGSIAAIAMREKAGNDGVAGHSWMHKGLVQARVKNSEGVSRILNGTLSSKVFYNSMMTSHNLNKGGTSSKAAGLQAYCTDTCITLPAIMLESLVYSADGVIELMPAMPSEWENGGTVSGVVTRTRGTVDTMTWDENQVAAQITTPAGTHLKLNKAYDKIYVNDVDVTSQLKRDATGDSYYEIPTDGEIQVRYEISDIQGGTFSIKSENDQYLGVVDIINGGQVTEEPVELSDNMLWNEVAASDTLLGFQNVAYEKQYIDIGSIKDGTDYSALCSWSGGVTSKNRQFRLEQSGDDYYIWTTMKQNGVSSWKADTDKVLEDYDGVVVYNTLNNENENQRWKRMEMNGVYAYQNKGTGRYIYISAGEDGTAIRTADAFNHRKQLWNLSPVTSNGYKIINTYTGKALTYDGETLTQFNYEGTDQQIWCLNDGNLTTLDGKEIGLYTLIQTPDITEQITIDKLTISANRTWIRNSDSVSFEATTEPEKGISSGIEWIVTNETGEATISSSGILVAKKKGTVSVCAKSSIGDVVSNSITITIESGLEDYEQVTTENAAIFGREEGNWEPGTVENAFDGDPSTAYDGQNGGYCGYELNESKKIAAFRFQGRSGNESRMDGNQFQVSNDGAAWTTIYTVKDILSNGNWNTVYVSELEDSTVKQLLEANAYRYFRLYSGTSSYSNVAEIELYVLSTGTEDVENTTKTTQYVAKDITVRSDGGTVKTYNYTVSGSQVEYKSTTPVYFFLPDVNCKNIESIKASYGFESGTSSQTSVVPTINYYAVDQNLTSVSASDVSGKTPFASAKVNKTNQWGYFYYTLNKTGALFDTFAEQAAQDPVCSEFTFQQPQAGSGVIVEYIPDGVSSNCYFDQFTITTTKSEETVDPVVKGDADNDGDVDADDVLYLLQCASGQQEVTDELLERADMNNDKKITAVDALLTLKIK
ncbi:MAG: glycosyl hydrolase family 95 catalytic domain-containing protein [Lachnospiraceae bacterium]